MSMTDASREICPLVFIPDVLPSFAGQVGDCNGTYNMRQYCIMMLEDMNKNHFALDRTGHCLILCTWASTAFTGVMSA